MSKLLLQKIFIKFKQSLLEFLLSFKKIGNYGKLCLKVKDLTEFNFK